MTLGLDIPALAQPDNMSTRLDSARRQPDAAKAAEQFEGLLIQQLWKTMRQTVQGGLLGDAPGSGTYLATVNRHGPTGQSMIAWTVSTGGTTLGSYAPGFGPAILDEPVVARTLRIDAELTSAADPGYRDRGLREPVR